MDESRVRPGDTPANDHPSGAEGWLDHATIVAGYQIRSLRRTPDSEGSAGLAVPFDPVPLQVESVSEAFNDSRNFSSRAVVELPVDELSVPVVEDDVLALVVLPELLASEEIQSLRVLVRL